MKLQRYLANQGCSWRQWKTALQYYIVLPFNRRMFFIIVLNRQNECAAGCSACRREKRDGKSLGDFPFISIYHNPSGQPHSLSKHFYHPLHYVSHTDPGNMTGIQKKSGNPGPLWNHNSHQTVLLMLFSANNTGSLLWNVMCTQTLATLKKARPTVCVFTVTPWSIVG